MSPIKSVKSSRKISKFLEMKMTENSSGDLIYNFYCYRFIKIRDVR